MATFKGHQSLQFYVSWLRIRNLNFSPFILINKHGIRVEEMGRKHPIRSDSGNLKTFQKWVRFERTEAAEFFQRWRDGTNATLSFRQWLDNVNQKYPDVVQRICVYDYMAWGPIKEKHNEELGVVQSVWNYFTEGGREHRVLPVDYDKLSI